MPSRQPCQPMPTSSAITTAIAEARDTPDISARVVLDSPVKASPTTGSTGAPHPTTLHGPVDRPSTLTPAPTTPPARPEPARPPPPARRSSQSAT